ncbi:GNAT family N-acetyltransferase [Crenobacter intestini]|uniref:L-ornithine N(alpha)-acyltransferase n=1 Tax=Crenobacter intestini TaxID=2563443 RepID=A0A4T0UWE7_9NEIS|nr:GNAT family N-acyltransferase [Crenobacter intestini]TIC83369.1 GNAT family N-acetyltransferase [Crenobacter intestini]
MLQLAQRATPATRLGVRLASSPDDVRRAQALRYAVFAEELGAALPSAHEGLDRDEYDACCDHLIVEDRHNGLVVGTYRLLPPQQAARLPRLYSEHEFDLSRLAALKPALLEVGRSCVHADYRGGAVIALLWGALADYARRHGARYLAGCASVGLADGGHLAASVHRRVETAHLSPAEWRVTPRLALPLADIHTPPALQPMPPLLRGYLRAGAWVCGEPAWDADFNCADFFVLLPLERLAGRHLRHFGG